jgi:hypothetical protein
MIYLKEFADSGRCRTSVATTSQGFKGTGLAKVEGLILRWPTGFFNF